MKNNWKRVSIIFIFFCLLFLMVSIIHKKKYYEIKEELLRNYYEYAENGDFENAESVLLEMVNNKNIFNASSKKEKFGDYYDLAILALELRKDDRKSIQMLEKSYKYADKVNKLKIKASLSIVYRNSGDYVKSLELLREVFNSNITNINEKAEVYGCALVSLLELYWQLQDFSYYDKALNDMKELIRFFPESESDDLTILYYLYSITYKIESNNINDIKEYFNNIKVIEDNRSFISVFTEMETIKIRTFAMYYEFIGENNEALDYYEMLKTSAYNLGDFYSWNYAYKKCIDINLKIGNNAAYQEELEDFYLKSIDINTFKAKQNSDYLNKIIENAEVERIKTSIFIMYIVFSNILILIVYGIFRMFKKAKEDSIEDQLCGTYNRRYLDKYLKGKGIKAPVSVIMIDVDYFKLYNDNYGHCEGDKVLKKVANLLKDTCNKAGVVFRYGGEEFCIVLNSGDKKEAIELSKNIKYNINKEAIEHKHSNVCNHITLSIGISTVCSKERINEAINEADLALYKTKENGRNGFTHYNDFN